MFRFHFEVTFISNAENHDGDKRSFVVKAKSHINAWKDLIDIAIVNGIIINIKFIGLI